MPSWDADLVVVGAGAELVGVARAQRPDGLAGRVTFLGFRSDVPRILSACDALVAPTRYEAYGAGVHEALCCALPRWSPRRPASPSVIPIELRPLLLEDPESADDVAAALLRWREKAADWRNEGARVVRGAARMELGRHGARDRFDLRVRVLRIRPWKRCSWHIVTGEYPPARGGVADYTRAVARALAAAGDDVHVWAPSVDGGLAPDPGVQLHPLPDGYSLRGLRELSRELSRLPGPKRILVQYVPHAFGMRAMNVPFCAWVAALREAEVWVMFHEVALPWERVRRWKANVGAAVTRVMANILLARADRVFISIPSWDPLSSAAWRPTGEETATWLPIPSNVPASVSEISRERARSRLRHLPPGTKIVGHFGTCGSLITPLLRVAVRQILGADPDRTALFVGRGSEAFVRELEEDPRLRGRVIATGELELVGHRRAPARLRCPHPTLPGRRQQPADHRHGRARAGSARGHQRRMALGAVWRDCGAVELARRPTTSARPWTRCSRDPSRAASLGQRGRALYARLLLARSHRKTLRGGEEIEMISPLTPASSVLKHFPPSPIELRTYPSRPHAFHVMRAQARWSIAR